MDEIANPSLMTIRDHGRRIAAVVGCATACLALPACYHPAPLDEQEAIRQLDGRTPAAMAPEVQMPRNRHSAMNPWDGIDADEAVALALVANPDLRAYRREREIAEAQVIAVSAINNPILRLEVLHLQEMGCCDMGWGVALAWTPPQPGVYSARRAQARAHVEEVRQEVFEHEWELVTSVLLAHATAVEFHNQRAPVQKSIELRKRLVEAIKNRVERGASTRLELLTASLGVARAEQELDDLDAKHAIAVRTLTNLIGVVGDKPFEFTEGAVSAVPADEAPVPDPGELSRKALSNLPRFRVAAARYEASAEGLRAEQAKRWPWIQLAAMPRYRHNDTSSHPNDLSVAVDVTLPIFDQNTGNIQAANAARLRAHDEFAAAVAKVRRDTATACTELEVRSAALKRYRDTILPALEEQERVLEVAFQGQNVDLAGLLAAQEAVLKIRREYVELRIQHHKAWLDLARTAGALPSTLVAARP